MEGAASVNPFTLIYFFIHTPKTSGTTFMEVLRRDSRNRVGFFYPLQPTVPDFENEVKAGPAIHRQRTPDWDQYHFIGGHFTFGIHEVLPAPQFKYLGVVRDPVSHFISAYRNFQRIGESYKKQLMPEIRSLEKMTELGFMHNMQTFFLSGLSVAEIARDKERAFETVIANSEKYFAGIYPTERFDEGLIYFEHLIGIKPMPYLRKNVAANPINDDINEALLARIRAINDVDIRVNAYFNKKFEEEFSRIPQARLKLAAFKLKNRLHNLYPASS